MRTNRPSLTFARVRAACLANVAALAPQLVPGGRWTGDWYMVRVPWRDDRQPSLHISRTSARWWDRGYEGDDNGGTLIDLVVRLDRCSLAQAKDRLAGMLGLGPEVAAPVVARPVPRCPVCRHVWHRYSVDDMAAYDKRYCTVSLNMLGEPYPTRFARRLKQRCGPAGKLWEARAHA